MIETHAITIEDIERTVRQRLCFDAGRALAIDRSRAALEARTALVRAALDFDLLEGRPPHGRASRIARKLRLNRRTVDRILATLMSVAK
jgi:hypothetical protein